MTGTFVAVVGPSGVGKDSLINYARDRLGNEVSFVRRVVTRSADGNSEDHDSLDLEAFFVAEAEGLFALSWAAHGLRYGLPRTLEDQIDQGQVVVANLSRRVVAQLVRRYPNAVVVSVVAEREVIIQRLARRGRESAQSIAERLNRTVGGDPLPVSTMVIDNSGDLAVAGEQFVRLLKDLAGLRVA
jgi:ribose 1,5-bisphosphokinase